MEGLLATEANKNGGKTCRSQLNIINRPVLTINNIYPAARKEGIKPLILNNMEIEKIIKIAESDFWIVTEQTFNNGKGLLFSKYSPAGQDFNISIEPSSSFEELLEHIKEYYDNFDVDNETYIWLDNDGHGKNGAPYRMRDVLEDMEECHRMILELYNLLKKNYDED